MIGMLSLSSVEEFQGDDRDFAHTSHGHGGEEAWDTSGICSETEAENAGRQSMKQERKEID